MDATVQARQASGRFLELVGFDPGNVAKYGASRLGSRHQGRDDITVFTPHGMFLYNVEDRMIIRFDRANPVERAPVVNRRIAKGEVGIAQLRSIALQLGAPDDIVLRKVEDSKARPGYRGITFGKLFDGIPVAGAYGNAHFGVWTEKGVVGFFSQRWDFTVVPGIDNVGRQGAIDIARAAAGQQGYRNLGLPNSVDLAYVPRTMELDSKTMKLLPSPYRAHLQWSVVWHPVSVVIDATSGKVHMVLPMKGSK